ncbi:type IV pilus biogenesis protein PilM [Herbaspirillum rubrisubalbicans]|nr:type IV pilus biogenesis protein PilM [Herbaspirillum rubrisubalbicans]
MNAAQPGGNDVDQGKERAMWGLIVALVMIAAGGFYSSTSSQALAVVQSNSGREVAAEMALYRQAVIDYFSAHDLRGTSVSIEALKSAKALPSWSVLYQQSDRLIWDNYRDQDGIIYIYATALPSTNITADLNQLSGNSLLVGVYRHGKSTLQSGIFGDTGIPVAALAGRGIADGAPLWIAMTQ